MQNAWLIAGVILGASSSFGGDTLRVEGWIPMELAGDEPPLALGDDPVYGRQLCPPLTRLNLALGRSENLLVRSAAVVPSGQGLKWVYQLRTGLAWWSGKSADSSDLSAFLEHGLRRAIQARGGGLWEVPPHRIAILDGQRVEIVWESAPAFGPYVINGMPFFRSRERASPSGKLGYECVGLYAADDSGVLTPSRAYSDYRALPSLRFERAAAPRVGTMSQDSWISFRQASSYAPKPSGAAPSCQRSIDLPVATLILWNLQDGPTKDARFRAVLASLLPREALIKAAAGGLGEVLSAPIPRRHPAYDGWITKGKHDMDAASTALGSLGYKRKAPDEPRLGAQGEPLALVFATAGNPSMNVVGKVLADSLAALGIKVDVRAEDAVSDGEKLAARLGVFAMDWPEADYLGDFHSKIGRLTHAKVADAQLDEALERHALSLTQAQPNFSSLAAVHARLAQLELVTVVMQHQACVEAQSGLIPAAGGLDTLDPDWFRRLVLGRARTGQ